MNHTKSNTPGVNDCKIVEELLSPFFDEELNETADTFVRHHLDGCRSCSDKLAEIKATVSAINELPVEATPERDLWPGIVAATAGSGKPLGTATVDSKRWYEKPLLLAAAVAALMIPGLAAGAFFLAGGEVYPAPPAPPEPAAVAAVPDFQIPDLGDVIAQSLDGAFDALDQLDSHLPGLGLEALISALQDEDEHVRRAAARALTDYDDPRALRALANALDDEDREVRRWAAWALGEIGSQEGVEPLSRVLLQDSVAEVRRWAAWALGEIQSADGAEALGRAVQEDDSPEVRRWAAWALGEIQSPAAVGALSRAVRNDESAEVRRWAAWALGEIQSPAAVGALSRALLDDDTPEVRRWSAWALGEIGSPAAAEALNDAMQDDNPEVRRWAIWAITQIRP